jgi:hypothetical protein
MKPIIINDIFLRCKQYGGWIKVFLICVGVIICLDPILSYAQSNVISFPVIDQLMCGFISYSKSKLAPYIAVLCVTLSVIGHWLGMSRLWGALLYVAMGLGLIMGIGTVITNATGSSASCIAS